MAQVLRILSLATIALGLYAADGVTVEVTVVNSVTGAGVAGVTVEMTASQAPALKFRAQTGPSGEFRFLDVSPGQHTISYEKDGFDAPDGETPESRVWVSAQGPVRVRMQLDPLTSLSGKVVDEENHPLKRITVELLTGRGQSRGHAATDDAGQFEVRHLHPGVYLVRAVPNRPGWDATVPVETNLKGAESTSLQKRTLRAPAYYPGVPSLAEASPIRVNGEGQVVGCDIRVRSQGQFAVRGRLVDPSGNPLATVTVRMKSADALYVFEGIPADAQVTTGSDGGFEFPAVTPGEWHLIAEHYPSPVSSIKWMGFASIRVIRRDLEDITLRLAKPFSLDVSVAGLPFDNSARRGPTIHLLPVDGPLEQEVQSSGPKNGQIELDRVYPGRYRILGGTRPGYYLDSILTGENDALGKEVELMEGATPIRLVYQQGGGTVRGKLETAGAATVVLVPELGSPDYWQAVKSDDQGRFEVGDLRPGYYFAIAVRGAGALNDPGFVSLVEREGTRLHVSAGETTSAELRLTTWPQ